VRLTVRRVNGEECFLAAVRGDREEARAIGRRAKAHDGAVPGGGERACFSGARIAHGNMVAVRLKAGTIRGKIGQIAVPQEDRLRVRRRIALGEVRRRAAFDGRFKEIKVRRPWLAARGNARRKHDALTVRAETELLIAAKGLRGHVGVERP
jgi:hypothetical protein